MIAQSQGHSQCEALGRFKLDAHVYLSDHLLKSPGSNDGGVGTYVPCPQTSILQFWPGLTPVGPPGRTALWPRQSHHGSRLGWELMTSPGQIARCWTGVMVREAAGRCKLLLKAPIGTLTSDQELSSHSPAAVRMHGLQDASSAAIDA